MLLQGLISNNKEKLQESLEMLDLLENASRRLTDIHKKAEEAKERGE